MFAVVDRGTARTPWEFSLGFGSSGATGALFPKNPKQPRCQHPVVRAPARAAPRRITLRSARQCRDVSLDPITEFSARPRRNEPARAARAPTRSVTIDTASRLTRMLASSRISETREMEIPECAVARSPEGFSRARFRCQAPTVAVRVVFTVKRKTDAFFRSQKKRPDAHQSATCATTCRTW
jgi:hypothetical protein